jgi:hypothetical protein
VTLLKAVMTLPRLLLSQERVFYDSELAAGRSEWHGASKLSYKSMIDKHLVSWRSMTAVHAMS